MNPDDAPKTVAEESTRAQLVQAEALIQKLNDEVEALRFKVQVGERKITWLCARRDVLESFAKDAHSFIARRWLRARRVRELMERYKELLRRDV